MAAAVVRIQKMGGFEHEPYQSLGFEISLSPTSLVLAVAIDLQRNALEDVVFLILGPRSTYSLVVRG